MLSEIASNVFNIYSIWFFVFQSAIWFGVCGVIAYTMSVRKNERQSSTSALKQNIGLFFLFIFMSTSLMFVMFGRGAKQTNYAPTPIEDLKI
jgi:hypothetical protein